ncbi:MAG: hypothetical protein BJ554DRAFT_2993 [Olpidium bornovanus]|uniref:Phospholipid/glycerol acyltransferase domain-containing protein n=1 Tax=Olpidium bornovanus TaxID=278681 RepID=A0A8H8DG69_9FUNG|nr:MAG: hypothetical protein BJ554DRAFT_2993 [Olpidium bornovanus]
MSEVPALYPVVRVIFWTLFNVFFHVEVVGAENMTSDGQPTILCANHSNSLTDGIAVVATAPRSKRKMVRLTAKDTFWKRNDPFRRGHFRRFTSSATDSILIRNVGTVPIKRRKDYGGQKVDNTESMKAIIECVEKGDCVGMFPEGISRYHPRMAPLRTGVAMIANDVGGEKKLSLGTS